MSISEAANRLNVSVDSVRRRLRSGVIHGERDGRGQWWLDLPDNIQPERQPPSVDERLALGMAVPAHDEPDLLIKSLQTTIDDLRSRLDRSERERREDHDRAAAERNRFLTLIEQLTRDGNPR
jgi:excisionase family DNA binding protein